MNKSVIAIGLLAASLSLCTLPTSAQGRVYKSQILRPNGKPAVGAKVRAFFISAPVSAAWRPLGFEEPQSGQTTRELNTVTDAAGYYRFETPPDMTRLQVVMIDAPGCALKLTSPAELPLKLEVDKPVEGRVVDEKSQPVSGAQVVTTIAGTNTYVPTFIQHPLRVRIPELTARTNADGRFRSRGVSAFWMSGASPSQLWAVAKTGDKTRMGTTGRLFRDEPLKPIVLYPNLTLRGRVVDSVTGTPLAGATVSLHDSGLTQAPLLTDAQGRFTFDDLAGHFPRRLTAAHPAYPGSVLTVRTEKINDALLEDEVVIGMHQLVRVAGRVTENESGKPLPLTLAATLSWQQNLAGWLHEIGGTVNTKLEDGSFELQAPAGPATLVVGDSFTGYFGDGRGAVTASKTALEVPKEGLSDVAVKLSRQPAYLVKFEAKAGDQYKRLTLYKRTPEGPQYIGTNDPLWFYRAAKWGETMEIRGVDGKGKEVLPWTKLTAEPQTWPTTIVVP